MRKLRSWIWHKLIYLADRISPEDAFRQMSGFTVNLKYKKGLVLSDSHRGVPIWYRGPDYEKIFNEYNKED